MSFVSFSKISVPLSTMLVLLLSLSSFVMAQRKPDFTNALNVAKVSAPLTNDERILAVGLAEAALKSKKLFSDRKMYLTEARINRDTESEMKGVFARLVVLVYYRYEGDLTLQVFMNLDRKQVLAVKQFPKLNPPISVAEVDLAKELAFNHPQLRDVLGPHRDRLVVDALTSRNESPKDPLFRHRVVYLLFRSGSTYLIQSRVFVDLTTESVIIEPASRKMPM
jgi:hypothetical protein